MPGLSKEYLLQKEVDSAPPAVALNQAQQANSEIQRLNVQTTSQVMALKKDTEISSAGLKSKNQALDLSLSAMKTSQGQLCKEMASVRNKMSEVDPRVCALNSQLSMLANQIPTIRPALISEFNGKLEQQVNQLTTIIKAVQSDLLGFVSGRLNETNSRIAINESFEVQQNMRELGYRAFNNNNILLYLASLAENISAAELNAATEQVPVTREITLPISYVTGEGENTLYVTHLWAEFEPVITPAVEEGVEYSAPTVTWKDEPTKDPRFADGLLRVVVTFDVDDSYAAGKAITVKFQVEDDDVWHGVSVLPLTYTYNVVA